MDDWRYEPAHDHGLPVGQRFQSIRRESGLVSSLTRHAWWASARAYMRIWHRLTVHGRDDIPAEAPFVMVANHCSHLDTLAMASVLPIRLRERAFPIAAGDTFFETTLRRSFSAMMLNALPMWRRNCGRHAVSELRERLVQEPCVFLLFPEGTRSRDGKMRAFKAGLGMLVAETSVPVVPCHLTGTFEGLPAGRAVPHPRGIALRIGEPVRFEGTPNTRAGWGSISQQLQERVAALCPC